MSEHRYNTLSHVFVLLLEPKEKVFECIKLDVLRDIGQATATIGDIIDCIPTKVTEPALVAQKHRGLCRRKGDDSNVISERSALASTCVRDGEILVAIPVGFTAENCRAMVQRILEKNPRVAKLLERPDPLAPRRGTKKRPKNMGRNKILPNSMSLEAIVEDDDDNKSERDMQGSISSNAKPSSADDFKLEETTSTSLASNTDDIKILLTEKLEKENTARKEIEALIRRESARKLLEERVKQNMEARAEIEERIVKEVKKATAGETSNHLTEEEEIERLALEATELETSLLSEHSDSRPLVSPPSSPERAFNNTAQSKRTSTASSLSSIMKSQKQHQDQAGINEPTSFRIKYKRLKRRLRRARIVTKQRVKDLLVENPVHLCISAAVVAAFFALYCACDPKPIGVSAYAVFILVFVVLGSGIRRRNRIGRKAMRRRSRSLSMTPRRKGSIRGIMGATDSASTQTSKLSSPDKAYYGRGN
mmetsp:Transcript_8624/g.18560  ORF Transcript_8624/g.18560 Transcript_8624/m.18560 type:complete len:479 (-) Transcript_8624:68-1504(-)